MTEIYTQREIVKGDVHRIAFMTPDILNEWLADGWSVLRAYPNAKLVRHKDGHLVEYQP